jgi:uronate dehydrogenase
MMKKLVLTGAGGRLGSYLREPLSKLAETIVSTDILDEVGTLFENETYAKADLANFQAMSDVIEGADMVVHFGAVGDEAPFEQIVGPNIVGAYNVWEAAYQHGVKRVVYASSIHAVGMYPRNEFIGTDVPHRPDTFYGLAKCFAEDLGRLYFDKRGLESVHLRILSCAQVTSVRALGTWLSYEDMVELVKRAIDTPVTGFAVIYGVSDNDRAPVDNGKAHFLGFRPKDNAEVYAEQILAEDTDIDPTDLAHNRHGCPFAAVPLGNSGQAQMKIIDDTKKT